MVKTEIIEINERQFRMTYSDENRYIARNGIEYEDAIDPIDTDRKYTEENIKDTSH